MALEMPESGYVWGKVPLEGDVRLTVVGEVHTWWSHWHRLPGRGGVQAVRCARALGVACAWCDAGYQRRARYVFPALVEGELRVFEVGRVQFPVLRLVCGEGIVGRRLTLRRAFKAKNAEIVIIPGGREHVSAEAVVDVGSWVCELGGGQLLLIAPPERVSTPQEASPAPPGLRAVPKP